LASKVELARGQPALTNRRASSRQTSRERLPWPEDKPFRILSLDGGGIKGVYASTLLRAVEDHLAGDSSIGDYFDLIAGTSTGGIIAVGLGLRHRAAAIDEMYRLRGNKIFPPSPRGLETVTDLARFFKQLFRPKFDATVLESELSGILRNAHFGDSLNRLVIPAFIVPKAEIAVFKTDHHPDYRYDHLMMAWEVARATSAAPTFIAGLEDGGHIFLDGGLWANNPIIVAIVEAMSAFDISLGQLQVLSIGTGSSQFEISRTAALLGIWSWRFALNAAMYLTTDNATAQAQLLIGHENVCRVDPGSVGHSIQMDDWEQATKILPREAEKNFEARRPEILRFFQEKCEPRLHFRDNQSGQV